MRAPEAGSGETMKEIRDIGDRKCSQVKGGIHCKIDSIMNNFVIMVL